VERSGHVQLWKTEFRAHVRNTHGALEQIGYLPSLHLEFGAGSSPFFQTCLITFDMSWNQRPSTNTTTRATDDDAWDGDIGDADDDLIYADDTGYSTASPAVLDLGQAYPGLSVCIVSVRFGLKLYQFQQLAQVCQERPPYSKGRKQYPTCGLTCADVLQRAQTFAQRRQIQVYLTNGRGQLPVEQQQHAAGPVQLVYVQQPTTTTTKRVNRPTRGLPCAVCDSPHESAKQY